ncbi:hypothetical protein L7F22_021869 [Adiantum nelumboides]|nr:hypothetical protein [Adiantum nelumboides]
MSRDAIICSGLNEALAEVTHTLKSDPSLAVERAQDASIAPLDLAHVSAHEGNTYPSCNIQSLKAGLSLALVDFYPVAGRLCRNVAGQLTINCNDAGVEFVEAVTDHSFHELYNAHFPILDFYDGLARVSHYLQHESLEDAPLLSIQVTKFKDGAGIAIGVAASHVVFDGHSLWYFLKAWGECCRKEGISFPPFHVRSVLKPECLLEKSKLPTKVDLVLPAPVFPKHRPERGHHRVLHFDAATVQQLKHTAIRESGISHVSSFQAVLAFVWKRVVASLDLSRQHKVCMNLKADLRKRLRPALTEAYFGNALDTLYVIATAGDLIDEGVGAIASRIHETIKVLDDQAYIWQRLAISKEAELNQLLSEIIQGVTQVMLVHHGSKFPVYQVDVGMGKPVAARPPTIHFDTSVVVYPGKELGAIDVCVRFTKLQNFQTFLAIESPSFDI